MVNPFHGVNWDPNIAERRKFAVSLVVGFPVVAMVFALAARIVAGGWNWSPYLWLAGIGAGLGVVFWTSPAIARPFYLAWYFVACCIGFVISNVLLMSIFFGPVTLTGLLLRLAGRDPISKGFRPGAKTYWQPAEPVGDPQRYYHQY